jgi:hypothetical protein
VTRIAVQTTEGDFIQSKDEGMGAGEIADLKQLVTKVTGAAPDEGAYLSLDLDRGWVSIPARHIYMVWVKP